jgi:hypothetical protein
MRIEIKVAGGELTVGLDRVPGIGFFATLERHGKRWEFDGRTEGYDKQRPLLSLLRWLADRQVYSHDDLETASLRWADAHEGRLSRGARIALQVLEALKTAAAE